MSWKECHVEDERLRIVACRLEGRRWPDSAPSSGSPGRPATRSLGGTRIVACRRLPTGAAGRIGRRTAYGYPLTLTDFASRHL
jgi:hypothetical protein